MLSQVTPILLTLDEMPNLERTFAPLGWARRIVVVDSGSTDGTREWLARDPRVALFVRPFESHAEQWEFALRETAVTSEWVLALDADHVLTSELGEEISRLEPAAGSAGYEVRFVYCIGGRRLRGSLYPPRIALARQARARFVQDGHTQRLEVSGDVARLRGAILHDDRKPRGRWLAEQGRYAAREARKLLAPGASLSSTDRIRRLGILAPWLVPLWCLIAKRGLLDGWPGWVYAGERAIAEWLLAIALFERRMAARDRPGAAA